MLPKDFAGIFSRFFISGFFVPVFFTLCILWLTVSGHFLPPALQGERTGTKLLILGGFSVLLGLFLQALRFPVIRFLEGYWIERWRFLNPLHRFALELQRGAYERFEKRGQWTLERRFPPEKERLLPTRFGNANRSYEDYPYTRWGLDMIAIFPRVDSLQTPREQELNWNAYTDVVLFINSTLGALAVGVTLLVDQIAHSEMRPGGWGLFVYVVPFLLAYAFYRCAIGAAERWGTERRTLVDLHRLEVYKALNVRDPLTHQDERDKIAPAVSDLLLYGTPLGDDLARTP